MTILSSNWSAHAMFRLVLLTTGFTLTATAALLNCLDKTVPFNKTEEVKKFTSRQGQVLFYPSEGYDGVTISMVVEDETTKKSISKENLCVNDSRWYRLEVTVEWTSSYYQTCTIQVDACRRKCGEVRDWSYDEFKSFSITARGASFWSLNNTHELSQCNSPFNNTLIRTDVLKKQTLPKYSNRKNGVLAGVGSIVFIVAAVAAVVCILRQPKRLRE